VEGTPFGRYRLQHLIGRGGMGEVWRAFDTETQRVVAIKLLPAQMASDEEFIERFRREARVAAGLNSPNVVPIHNFGEIDGRLYVDMALIDGRDLQAVLDEGPMRPDRAVRIIEQVAAALRAAHTAGLVHRDVKPSNILLNADDFAYLIDFGLARTDEDAGLTVTGHTVGTFAYMAPERYEGRAVDSRTDVYSLACVLYQCLTGTRPFAGSGAQQMLAHIQTPPPRPSDTVPGLPRGLDAVVTTGMAKQVDARYPTIDGFARATREALTQTAPVSPQTRPWQQPPPQQPPPTQQYRPPVPQPAAFSAPPHYGPPPQSVVPRASASAPWFRRTPVLVIAACVAVAIVAVTAVILTTTGGGSSSSDGSTTAAAPVEVNWGDQVDMPSEGLADLGGMAINSKGNVVGVCCKNAVGSEGKNAIYQIAADMQTPPKLVPLPQIDTGPGTAAEGDGTGYLAEVGGPVIRIDQQDGFIPLDFPNTERPAGIAVDGGGAVYVINRLVAGDPPKFTAEVWKLDKGATESTTLPFNGPNVGYGIAVDKDGAVYVTDPVAQGLQKLALGETKPTTIAFPAAPVAVAVDGDGAVYAATSGVNGDAVYRLPPGGDTPEKLPISGIKVPSDSLAGLAVDRDGSVYVADVGGNRVVKLPRVSP
jgi:serine/threonine protein kinase, bacterial